MSTIKSRAEVFKRGVSLICRSVKSGRRPNVNQTRKPTQFSDRFNKETDVVKPSLNFIGHTALYLYRFWTQTKPRLVVSLLKITQSQSAQPKTHTLPPALAWNQLFDRGKTQILAVNRNLRHFSSTQRNVFKIQRRNYACDPEKPTCRIACQICRLTHKFNPWVLLSKMGVPNCQILQFRRRLRRYYYPWFYSCVPTAFALGMGDIIAQLYMGNGRGRNSAKKRGDKKLKEREINWCRTLHFAAIGGLILGPMISKWSLRVMRSMSRGKPNALQVKSLMVDMFITAPVVVLTLMSLVDYEYVRSNYQNLDKLRDRYKETFVDIMTFYIATKPMVTLISSALLQRTGRKYVRLIYNVLFFAYLSNLMDKNRLGGTVMQKGGRGGPICKLYDWLTEPTSEQTPTKKSTKK